MAHKRAHPKKAAFLAAFSECGNVSLAAQAAKIDRRRHYDWLENDEEYKAAFEDAQADAVDRLEAEARRRGEQGYEEPIVYQGRMSGVWVDKEGNRLPTDSDGNVIGGDAEGAKFVPLTVRKYSDTLLLALLNAHHEKFNRQKHEIAGKDGGPIVFTLDLGAAANDNDGDAL